MSIRRYGPWAFVAALLGPQLASAELGRTVSSLPAETGLIAPHSTTVSMGAYTRVDTVRANGGAVHELVNLRGQVFAVTWSGPGKPDLRTLLGGYFGALQPSEGPGRALHSLRRPLSVDTSGVQIQAGGHLGWFHGAAFLPALAPAGFARADLAPQP